MRTVKRVLRHPVTGELQHFTLRSAEDSQAFNQMQREWGQMELQGRSGGQDATSVEQPNQTTQVGPGGDVTSGVIPTARGRQQPDLRDADVLRSMTPSLLASLASFVPPMRYGALARTGLSAALAALGAPIAGTDPKREALTAGLMQLPGEGLMAMTRGLGTGAVRRGFNASPELQEDFGNIGKAATRERIGVGNLQTISEGPERAGVMESALGNPTKFTGSAAASEKMDTVKEQMTRALTRDQRTHNVVRDILRPARNRIYSKIRGKPRWREEVREMDRIFARTAMQNPGDLDNLQLFELKQGANRSAVDLLNKSNKPTVSSAEAEAKAAMEEMVDKEIGAVANERLHKVPGYRSPALRFRELEGIRRAAMAAETGKDLTASPRVVGGGANTRMAINPIGMMSPQALTSLGRSLEHPVTAFGAGNIPRALLEAMRLNDPTLEPFDVFKGKEPQ